VVVQFFLAVSTADAADRFEPRSVGQKLVNIHHITVFERIDETLPWAGLCESDQEFLCVEACFRMLEHAREARRWPRLSVMESRSIIVLNVRTSPRR
jgi:hypothetical protein